MDLFTIDNVGESDLLNQETNENLSVKFERAVDTLKDFEEAEEETKPEVENDEEDVNLSDADFGGKFVLRDILG